MSVNIPHVIILLDFELFLNADFFSVQYMVLTSFHPFVSKCLLCKFFKKGFS